MRLRERFHGFMHHLREQPKARKIGAGIAAAALVPSGVFAATHHNPAPMPKGPPPVVRVVDAGQMSTLDAQIQQIQLSRAPKTITRQIGTQTVSLRISSEDLASFTPEQRQAYTMLRALFETIEPSQASYEALRALIPGDATPLMIDKTSVARTAAHLANVGLPLSPGELADFRSQRSLDTMPAKELALQYAHALGGNEILFAVPASPNKQQAAAIDVFRHLERAELEELLQHLGVAQPKEGPLALQSEKLHNFVVTTHAVDRLVEEASLRGIELAGAGPITRESAQHIDQLVHRVGERPADEAGRAAWYERVVESQGHVWRTGANEVNIIGLRGYDVDNGKNPNAFNRWNDTLAFVWKDGGGAIHVREFRATTDPGITSYSDTPDANGDGAGDVADLVPGQYPYSLGTHRGNYGAGNPGYNLPVSRDTNHNGSIENGEFQASRERGDVGYGINIHWGPGAGASEVGLYSAGCQVAQIDYGSFRSEITPLLELNEGQLKYTLVDMSSVA